MKMIMKGIRHLLLYSLHCYTTYCTKANLRTVNTYSLQNSRTKKPQWTWTNARPNLYLSLLWNKTTKNWTDQSVKDWKKKMYIERLLFQGEEDSRCHDLKKKNMKMKKWNRIEWILLLLMNVWKIHLQSCWWTTCKTENKVKKRPFSSL